MSAKPTIWVFKLKKNSQINPYFLVECQADAVPVFFGKQQNRWYVWMQLSPANTQRKTFKFYIIGTGEPIPPNTIHVQSVQDGLRVCHLYQEDFDNDTRRT